MKRHSTLRKMLVSALVLAVSVVAAMALEVSRGELQSVNSDTIRFNNYNGPHTVIDSLAAIRNIGTGLGRQIAGNLDNESTAGSENRYYVIHAVDSTTGKLDADIFVLGKNVGVDHVRNLRHIIAAYLVEAYKYSNDDAFTLATFITVYNAVYRGNIDVFNAKYKPVVTKYLHKDSVGLSVNWEEWAGKTEMVIPLADLAGGLSTIDTSVISDRNVIDSMRESDDRGIEQRKGMVGIMDREADTAEEKAETAARQAVQETRKLSEEQKKLAEEQSKSAEAQKSADAAQKSADAAQKSADAAQKAADEAQSSAQKAAEEAQKAADAAEKAAQSASSAQQSASDAQKAAEDAQKAADAARAEAEQKQKEADEAKAKADELQKKADELAEYARQHPDDAEAQKAAEEAQKAADAARAEADKKEGEATKAQSDAEKAEENAQQQQENADEKAAEAAKQQQQADSSAKESEQKQSEADKKAEEAEQKQSTADSKRSEADSKQSEADKKAEEAEKQKQAEQAQKDKTDEQAQKAADASEEAREQQEIADRKRSEAQNERNLIARDQQQLLNEGLLDEKDAAYGLQLTDSAKELSSMVKMNAKTGMVVKTSPVSVIRQRELVPVEGGFVAIAGEEGANHTIRLVLLDTADLEIQKESADIVAAKSVLVYNGGSFFVVVQDGANYVVAKYSANIELELKSSVAVDPATPITVGANGICVTAKDGSMVVLKTSDLSVVSGEVGSSRRR